MNIFEKTGLSAIGVLIVIGIAIPLILYNSFCFMIIWNWTMPPLFGLPVLSWPYSVMIGMVIAYYNGYTPKDEDGWKAKHAIQILLRPVVFVLVAWIAKGYIT